MLRECGGRENACYIIMSIHPTRHISDCMFLQFFKSHRFKRQHRIGDRLRRSVISYAAECGCDEEAQHVDVAGQS
jgi:hypothetical protein